MKTNIIRMELALLLFCSCSWEQERVLVPANGESVVPETRALMQVEITENSGEGSDRIKTIRFIVFTDLASMPKTEKNVFYSEGDFIAEQSSGQAAASRVKIILELGRKVNYPNDKLVVAIANEPPAMTGALNAVMNPGELAGLELDMAHFVTADHLSLTADAMMPMSGVAWTDDGDLYSTEDGAESHQVPISLERSVARVDIHVNTDMSDGLQMSSGSRFTLDNTYTKGFLVRHEGSDGRVFGKMPVVPASDLVNRLWQGSGPVDIPCKTPLVAGLVPSAHVCTFYTPERNCSSGRLKLDVDIRISGDDGFKSGGFTLHTANDGNSVSHAVDMIRRNRIYKVTVTVGSSGIISVIQDWNSEEIPIEL